MKFSNAFRVLVFSFPVFVVSFAVIVGGALLASGMGDQFAGRLLSSVAVGFGIAALVNMILLVGMLGLKSTIESEQQQFRQDMRRRMHKRRAKRHRKKMHSQED